jgi:hypothetical protein
MELESHGRFHSLWIQTPVGGMSLQESQCRDTDPGTWFADWGRQHHSWLGSCHIWWTFRHDCAGSIFSENCSNYSLVNEGLGKAICLEDWAPCCWRRQQIHPESLALRMGIKMLQLNCTCMRLLSITASKKFICPFYCKLSVLGQKKWKEHEEAANPLVSSQVGRDWCGSSTAWAGLGSEAHRWTWNRSDNHLIVLPNSRGSWFLQTLLAGFIWGVSWYFCSRSLDGWGLSSPWRLPELCHVLWQDLHKLCVFTSSAAKWHQGPDVPNHLKSWGQLLPHSHSKY